MQRRGNSRQEECGGCADRRRRASGRRCAVHLFPDVQPQFSGLIAWRGRSDATALPPEYTAPRVQLWMGPDAHLVAYPISAGRQISVVAISVGHAGTGRAGARPATSTRSEAAFATRALARDRRRMLIGAVDGWRKSALFTLPDLGRLERRRGDVDRRRGARDVAVCAQGAGMAIEDAAVLAKALGDSTGKSTAGIPAGAETLRTDAARTRAEGAAHGAAAGLASII